MLRHVTPAGRESQAGAEAPGRQLARNRSDRIVAGVAAGLGDLLGVDRVVVRLAFVVLSFAGGVGVVAYLLLWLLSSEPPRSPAFEEPSVVGGVARVEKTVAVGVALAG